MRYISVVLSLIYGVYLGVWGISPVWVIKSEKWVRIEVEFLIIMG